MKNPKHIAIIMDGNRRWAKRQGLAIIKGHRKMTDEVIEELADASIKNKIKFLTLWAFSTENWKRNKKEVADLMMLFREMFKKNAKKLHEKGVKIMTIGDLSRFDRDIQESINFWIKETRNNKKITVIFALNYGGRDEMVRAVERARGLDSWKASELEFSKLLDTKDIPDPDIIIRPGGEKRLSGFLLWQSSYAELFFTDVLAPDFRTKQLEEVIKEFKNRQRRFGG
jgi:undecaprenyl diphosphate synthase